MEDLVLRNCVFDDTSQQPITVSKLAAEAQKQVVKTVKN